MRPTARAQSVQADGRSRRRRRLWWWAGLLPTCHQPSHESSRSGRPDSLATSPFDSLHALRISGRNRLVLPRARTPYEPPAARSIRFRERLAPKSPVSVPASVPPFHNNLPVSCPRSRSMRLVMTTTNVAGRTTGDVPTGENSEEYGSSGVSGSVSRRGFLRATGPREPRSR
jgi:hypothetical protein